MPIRGAETQAPLAAEARFGAEFPWSPLGAAAVAGAIVLAAALLATAATSFATRLGLLAAHAGGGLALSGLVWLLAFQIAVAASTWAAAGGYGGEPRHVLSMVPPRGGWRTILLATAALFAFAAAYAAIVYAVDRSAIVRDLSPAAALARSEIWVIAVVSIGVGAPLAEELLFRGFLFPALTRSRLGLRGAAVTSTLAWTALHAGYSLYGLVEVLAVGLIFCWLLVRSGSLWVPIACHAIYNTAIMLGLRWLPIPL